VLVQDSDAGSVFEQGTSTFCARNASYRGRAAPPDSVDVDHAD